MNSVTHTCHTSKLRHMRGCTYILASVCQSSRSVTVAQLTISTSPQRSASPATKSAKPPLPWQIAMSSPVADTLTIVQTIHKLYRKGYVVARNAPKDVRQVVDDLEMLGRLLYTLKRQMDRHGDSSFRQSYHGNLEDCLHRCNQAVNEFERLLQQFRTFSEFTASRNDRNC
jgi:hypothetical protein